MKNYTIYNKNSGEITSNMAGLYKDIKLNLNEDEEIIEGTYPNDKYKIKDSVPILIPEKPKDNPYLVYDIKANCWSDQRDPTQINIEHKNEIKNERKSKLDLENRISLLEAMVDFLLNEPKELYWKVNGEFVLLTSEHLKLMYEEERAKTQKAFMDEKAALEKL